MASDLYDTGAPRKVHVVNDRPERSVERVIERERVEVIVCANICRDCGKPTRTTPCEWCHPATEPMREAERARPPALPQPRTLGALRQLGRAAARALLEPPK